MPESLPASQPEQNPDEIIAELIGQGPAQTSEDVFAGMPSWSENYSSDLRRLPKGQQGFFGAHLVAGEDGHFMKHPDGTPVRWDEIHTRQPPDRKVTDLG